MTGTIASKTEKKDPFPSAMTCHGDFCTMKIRDAAELANDRGEGGGGLRGHGELMQQFEQVKKLKKQQVREGKWRN